MRILIVQLFHHGKNLFIRRPHFYRHNPLTHRRHHFVNRNIVQHKPFDQFRRQSFFQLVQPGPAKITASYRPAFSLRKRVSVFPLKSITFKSGLIFKISARKELVPTRAPLLQTSQPVPVQRNQTIVRFLAF